MKQNIIVFFGGVSVEHDISIITGVQTLNALNKHKYNVIPLYIDKVGRWYTSTDFFYVETFSKDFKMAKKIKEVCVISGKKHLYLKTKMGLKKWVSIDCALLCNHGGNGENGALQGFFEVLDIPYTGCDVLSSAICMEKIATKKILKESGVAVVDYSVIDKSEFEFFPKPTIDSVVKKLGFPLIVKPSKLGSSVGISVCKNKKEFLEAVKFGFSFGEKLLIEKVVENLKEINLSILATEKEILFSKFESPFTKNNFLSFEDKYLGDCKTKNNTDKKREFPAKINKETENTILKMAKLACDVLQIKGLIRIDFLFNLKTEEVFLNEINTIPGSLAFYLWEDIFTFSELLDRVIAGAFQRFKNKKGFLKTFESSVLSKNFKTIK